jgi:1-acyl-sn-glycerol-3-phosphate acyltransferase
MIWLRSVIFNLLFYLVTAIFVTAGLPSLVSQRWALAYGRAWVRASLALLPIVGLRYRIKGTRLAEPAIYASKHQSAWDTMIFQVLVLDAAFVLKRELLWLPFFGLYVWRGRHVAIDRKAGGQALRRMLKDGDRALAEGRSIVIFPEGTRTAPGADAPYLPGVAALYKRLGIPVVPVALNSGLFWGRRSFLKRPGTMTLEYLEPIPPGLGRAQFETLLRERIEAGSKRLLAEAGQAPEE